MPMPEFLPNIGLCPRNAFSRPTAAPGWKRRVVSPTTFARLAGIREPQSRIIDGVDLGDKEIKGRGIRAFQQ